MQELKILWIPHNSWEPGRYQRDQYFIRNLGDRHKLFVLLWDSYLPHTLANLANPKSYCKALRFHARDEGNCVCYHGRRLPRIPMISPLLDKRGLSINSPFLREAVHSIKRAHGLDVIVFSNFGQPFGTRIWQCGVPYVFDYVDWGFHHENVERELIANAAKVVCVSQGIKDRVSDWHADPELLTNGVELERFRRADGEAVRRRFGLEHKKVVSLIGLTTSPTLYFLEAVQRAKRHDPEIRCLLVGESKAVEEAVTKLDPHGETFIYVGAVPYEEIADYFAATDVGLYPGDETPFFHYASPIKVIEYSAAGKPVVVPRLHELERLDWPNLIFRPPTADAFADGIIDGLRTSYPVDNAALEAFDWQHLSRKLESTLVDVANTAEIRSSTEIFS